MDEKSGPRWTLTVLLLATLCFVTRTGYCYDGMFYNRKELLSGLSRARFIRSSRTTPDAEDTETKPFLKMVEDLHNITIPSEGKAVFKCKVQAYPKKNITFLWFKDNNKLIPDELDRRIHIRYRDRESRLIISDAFSWDSGQYRCEVSNIERRVISTAYLHVGFNLLPEDTNTDFDDSYLKGSCQKYTGHACRDYLETGCFYKEAFQVEDEMEQQIMTSLKAITEIEGMSSQCRLYTKKAFCVYLFPPCKSDTCENQQQDDVKPLRLCREDCDLLKYDVCKEDFQRTTNKLVLQIMNEADCSQLPPTTTTTRECTSVGLPRVVDAEQTCYDDNAESYRGTLSVTMEGKICQTWPDEMKSEYSELSGGHNFCRNPGELENAPWCFVGYSKTRQICQVPSCKKKSSSTDLVMIIIPAVSVPLLLGCFLLVFCLACRRRKTNTTQHTKGFQLETKAFSTNKVNLPELNANLIQFIGDLGDGKFGKVTKAKILSNLHYCPSEPVAVKSLQERATAIQVQDFQREMETFSVLQHPNVACLKAIVSHNTFRCMIFEYTSSVDLHEYLVLHSPQADFAKPPSSVSSHTSSVIDHVDFIRMAIQVTAGMEYLTRSNFIHRDLAARNILVCGNMELKITNLGVVRDSYVSSYYRSPQGGQMLPIRWMAPESIYSWKFSDKSTVWSFGVLLWEMFSYGSQPYCGYSNQEVLEMISHGQLLNCPDQCPAKMYSLMQECWSSQPQQRPEFKDIHAKLVGWEGTTTTRMTSQLAQGIHRQLDMMKEHPNGQFAQYGPPQGRMINDNMYGNQSRYPGPPAARYSATTPTPPPNFARNYSEQHEPRLYNGGNYQHQPYPGQQVGQPMMGYPHGSQSYSGPPSRSSGSVASSDFNHHPNALRVNNLPSHQEVQEPSNSFPPPPPFHAYYPPSGRSSRPIMENSTNGERPGLYVNLEKSNSQQGSTEFRDEQSNHRNSRPSSRMRNDSNLQFSVYQEPRPSDSDNRSPSHPKPTLSSKPPSYYTPPTVENLQSSRDVSINAEGSGNQNNRSKESEEKTLSCDSGLPNDDMDSEGADSHRPLLSVASGNPLLRSSMNHSLKIPPTSAPGSS